MTTTRRTGTGALRFSDPLLIARTPSQWAMLSARRTLDPPPLPCRLLPLERLSASSIFVGLTCPQPRHRMYDPPFPLFPPFGPVPALELFLDTRVRAMLVDVTASLLCDQLISR